MELFAVTAMLLWAAGGPPARGATAALGDPDFYPSPQRPVGFRGDRTGRYPAARPPLHWSTAYNVIWRTRVGVGESSPVLVGGRIFILTDGIVLRCLDKRSGKVLWDSRGHARANDGAESAAWKVEQFVRLHHQARPTVAAARMAERELAGIRRDVESGRRKADADAEARLQRRIERLRQDANAILAGQAPLGVEVRPAATYAIATPCSDGEAVYAFLPTGEVVCYSLDGERRWLVALDGMAKVGGGWYGAQVGPSPVLVDGRLVVHYGEVYCLDAAGGRLLWRTPLRRLPIASPTAGRAGGATYVAVGTGHVLRLADGKMVGFGEGQTSEGGGANVGSPIFADGCFYWHGLAVRLPQRGDANCQVLYRMTRQEAHERVGDAGWHGYATPLLFRGRIFTHWEHSAWSLLDLRTGEMVARQPLPMRGEIYPSTVLAGEYLFLASKHGQCLVLRPRGEADFEIAAENWLDYLGGNVFVFEGERMYAHSDEYVYCIGDPLGEAHGPSVRRPGTLSPREVMRFLDGDDDLAAFATARELAGRGGEAAAIVPELLKRLDPNLAPGQGAWRPMRNALLALRALGPAASDAAGAVVPLLDTPRRAGRRTDPGWAPWAADALAAIGPAGAVALGRALTGTVDRRPLLGTFGQDQALKLLERMGGQARPAGAELVKLLADRNVRLRLRAAEVLASADPDAARRRAVPALLELADPPDERSRQNTRFRAEVVAVLGRLGPLAAGAAQRLRKLASEDDADLRAAAAETLKRVSGS